MTIMQSYKDLNIDYTGGDFDISSKILTSLVSCPQHITGDFICSNNDDLSSLVGGPTKVDGNYYCNGMGLTDMTGCATYIGGRLRCNSNDITSLAGCPSYITSDFDCSYNDLRSLVGGPQKVDGDYMCNDNPYLRDLVGCASHIGRRLYTSTCWITSLVGIHKIIKSCPNIEFDCETIDTGGIGLLLIDNLTNISDETIPFFIIGKYLGTGTKGMMECRAELIAKGYDNYAKL